MKILLHTASLKGMDMTQLKYDLAEPLDLQGETYILFTEMESVNQELMRKLPEAEAVIVSIWLNRAKELRISSITIYPRCIKFLLVADVSLATDIANKIIRSIPLSHLVLEKSDSA